jgi:hypothetical protein
MRPDVQAAFEAFPEQVRERCLALRALIFDVAADMREVGQISEELRWGEPAYLTPQTRAGSTIRIGVPKAGGYALFVNCRTRLIEEFRPLAPPDWRFEGTRAVLFRADERPSEAPLALLVRAALSYHLRARARR